MVNANIVDPDKAPRSAVSDLCQHCLPVGGLKTEMCCRSPIHYENTPIQIRRKLHLQN